MPHIDNQHSYKTKVTRWIWAGCAIILFATAGVGFHIIVSMNLLLNLTHDIYQHPFAVSNAAAELRMDLLKLRNKMLRLAASHSQAEIEQMAAETQVLAAATKRQLALIRERYLGDSNEPVRLQQLLDEANVLRERIVNLARTREHDLAQSLATIQGSELFSKLDKAAGGIVAVAGKRGAEFVTEAEVVAREEIRHNLLLLVALSVAVLLITFVVTRRISRELRSEAERRAMIADNLAASEERLRTVIDVTADAIIAITPTGLLESANPATSQLFGYRSDELIGSNISMLMPEPDRSRHDGYLAAYQAGGERKVIGFRREVTAQRKDGTLFPVELAVSESSGNNKTRYVGIVRDISATVQARDELKMMQRFIQSTLDALNASICVLDHHGIVIHANMPWQQHARASGLYEKDGGIGSDYLMVSEAVRDSPGHQGHLIARALRRVLDGEEDSFFAEYPCDQGNLKCWMMLSATSFDANSGRWVVISHEDISELRGSQHELAHQIEVLHTTLETMRQGILMVDRDHNVVTTNRKYFQLMQLPLEFYGRKNLTMQELLRFQAQRGDYGPGDPEAQVRVRIQVFDQVTERRSERTFADGSVVEIYWSTLPHGRGAVATFNDITLRKRAEIELRRAKDAADAASEAKSAFLATMSHEIRTPMYGILGMAELLEATPLTTDQQKMVKTVRDSGNALLAIINDILDLSRIEAGKLSIDPHPMSLRATVQAVLDILTPSAQKKGLNFYANISSVIPDHLIGDAVRVRQILFNLIGNAIKFTTAEGSGGQRGRVTLRAQLEPVDVVSPGIIRFLIEDNGIGMSEEAIARLFQPFSQADSATTRRYGGSGLGLSICARLVDLMGGQIDVTSHPGEGSVFVVRLPFLVTPAAEEASSAVLPAPTFNGVAPPVATGEIRLLVAEDNEINQELIHRQLARLGYVADIVGNGREALEQLPRGDYALLLTDCHMPEMDGYDLARAVRAAEGSNGRHLPILGFTANILVRDVQRCHEAGMDDVVGKPSTLDELGRTLARWVAAVPAAAEMAVATVPAIVPVEAPPDPAGRTVQFERLNDLIGTKHEAHVRVLNKFMVAAHKLLDEIVASTEQSDTATLSTLGHKFKSSARAIGADALADACAALEAAGNAGDAQACGAHATAVATHFATAVPEIEAYLATTLNGAQ